jgi:hypothetical protein
MTDKQAWDIFRMMTGKALSTWKKTLSITNPTWTDMGLNQGLHRVRNKQSTALGIEQLPPS